MLSSKRNAELFNTLSHQVEEFKPLNPPTVTMYTCGPTVYNFMHIGNLRTFVFPTFYSEF